MPATTSALVKRNAVIEYFQKHNGWVTLREIANYLGTSVQTARFHAESLKSAGLLEKATLNVKSSDNVVRPTNHYRRARRVKKLSA